MLATTWGMRSRPTRSTSPKTPVFGMPTAGPSAASARSTLNPARIASTTAHWSQYTPMRLAMNPGVSLHSTTPLPSRRSANSRSRSTWSGRVRGPRTISSSRMYRGGLKKWVMAKSRCSASDAPSTSRASGMVEVFEETMVPGRRTASSRA